MSLTESFEAQAKAWQIHIDQNAMSANPFVYIDHTAFEAIVALGAAAIPLILKAYEDGHLFWGAALCRITGKEDFGNGLTGNLSAQRQAWLDWGAKREA